MLVYAIVMFAIAALFVVLAVLICRGKTELIHGYHRTKVTDQAAYGKAFGRALSAIPVGMIASGTIALFGEKVMWAAVAVLLLGLGIGLIAIFRVQKKYNGGLFG